MIGGQRKSRKSRNSARKTRRRTQQRGGGDVVYVLYESGAPEGLKFVGVFRTLEAAKVEALIELLNNDLDEARQFNMVKKEEEDRVDDGMMAYSESEPNKFYCKPVQSFQ